MSLIQQKLTEFLSENTIKKLRDDTGIGCKAIYSIKNGYKNKKYTKQTLDTLYDYFEIKQDQFYNENMKKWLKSDESILGNLLKKKEKTNDYRKKKLLRLSKELKEK